MSKSTPEYNRQSIAVTFATSGTEYMDTTITKPSLLHSLLVVAHTWPVVAAGASGASGANVVVVDSGGNTIKTFAEVLTGSTTLLSGDVMLFPNDIVRYQITDGDADNRCVSGAAVPTSRFPTATVVLFLY